MYHLFGIGTLETLILYVAGRKDQRFLVLLGQQAHGPLQRHLWRLALRLPVWRGRPQMRQDVQLHKCFRILLVAWNPHTRTQRNEHKQTILSYSVMTSCVRLCWRWTSTSLCLPMSTSMLVPEGGYEFSLRKPRPPLLSWAHQVSPSSGCIAPSVTSPLLPCMGCFSCWTTFRLWLQREPYSPLCWNAAFANAGCGPAVCPSDLWQKLPCAIVDACGRVPRGASEKA